MKTLYLMGHRLLQYFRRSKTVFLLFLLGGMVNALVMAYLYGNLMPAVINRNSQEIQYRRYHAYFTDYGSTPPEREAIEQVAASPMVESVTAGFEFNGSLENYRYDWAVVSAPVGELPPLIVTAGEARLTQDDQVIVPRGCTAKTGSGITILGREYTVVGRTTSDEFYITQKAFQEQGLEVNTVTILARERQNLYNDPMEQYLKEAFPGGYIRTPYIYQASDDMGTTAGSIMLCGCFAVVCISFMYLLVYMIDQSMDENIISMIVGAAKRDITFFIFWEGLLLSAGANILGLLLHALLEPSLFKTLNISTDLVYTLSDYLSIFLMMLVVTVLILLLFLRKYRKLSPIQARQARM